MFGVKFKIYDEKKKKLLSGTGYSITGDGEVQTFNKNGVPEGTLKNRHLRPVFSSGKKDIAGREIYEGFIVNRVGETQEDKGIIGVATFVDGTWWIVDKEQNKVEPLFLDFAIDRVIGNIYEN